MSEQPPPQSYPRPGYDHPDYYRAPPKKKRPKPVWFVVGAVLLVLGIAISVALFVQTARTVTDLDGVITANGQPASIDAPPGQKRMLFVPRGQLTPICELVDGSGQPLLLRAIFGDATVTTGGTAWHAFAQVDSTGDGKVTITCRPTSSGAGSDVQVRMGAPVDVRTLGAGIIGGLAALFVLGGLGFVTLLVTTILWFSRTPQGRV